MFFLSDSLKKKILVAALGGDKNAREMIVSEARESIDMYLSADDVKACALILKDKFREAVRCPADSIKVAQKVIHELICLIGCNIEPNAEDSHQGNQ